MSSCVNLGLGASNKNPAPQADPPQRQLPQAAKDPCQVSTLPTQGTPTLGDLEIGYVKRGAEVAVCDARRELAVQAHEGEHQDEAKWKAERVKRNCPWYKFGTCK